ncbi:DUF6301 family protein [Dactylosporangium siamense]|uniref:TY-Chap N-terminal domain-containing protein n=1 Tax=Dactylosporangium siamense TaxID=685454 RepID=A0A919PFP2_9ACTN|nr:hypothetical protein [Dactylosporangium siamense]GIG43079.1 hypothetical protein Dsi01nite_011200 [Dactylosporangium siamense]
MSQEHQGWPAVQDELADALLRLRPEDAISLDGADGFVQFIRFGRGITVKGPSVLVHTKPGEPGSPTEAALTALGWTPSAETETTAQPEAPAPLDQATAARWADVIVRTLRDVRGIADPATLTYSSFNNNGLRAPRLHTVTADAEQAAPDPDPATLLPPPSPAWRQWCTLFADGIGDWSQAAFDRLVAEQGWQDSSSGRHPRLTAAGGERVSALTYHAGHRGHGEVNAVSVALPVAEADLAQVFRQALAGAAAALGHPPLVGDMDREPFARWRGARTTLTLSAHLSGEVQLLVEPTEPRETVIYNDHKWMMSPDDWSPDELWMTEPDVEAPEAKQLLGMMSYPHSTSTTLDGTIEELRLLFTSWSSALPLLHPYARTARWRLSRRKGDMIAEGRFSRERVTARFGWSDQYGARLAAAPGPDVTADLVERVRAALDQAGITTPEELGGAAWSDTPAERMYANRLTLEHG